MGAPPPLPAYDIPHNKKIRFLAFQWNVTYFNLSALLLVLSAGTTETGSLLFIASHQVFMRIDKITPELSLVQAEKSASSHMRDASGP